MNTFLNNSLDKTIYCYFPNGFKQYGYYFLLLKVLYGLHQSPLLWLNSLSTLLLDLGLQKVDLALFCNDWLTAFFYVDDIVFLCRTHDNDHLELFVQSLMSQFEMRDLEELYWFLGIRVKWDQIQQKL